MVDCPKCLDRMSELYDKAILFLNKPHKWGSNIRRNDYLLLWKFIKKCHYQYHYDHSCLWLANIHIPWFTLIFTLRNYWNLISRRAVETISWRTLPSFGHVVQTKPVFSRNRNNEQSDSRIENGQTWFIPVAIDSGANYYHPTTPPLQPWSHHGC